MTPETITRFDRINGRVQVNVGQYINPQTTPEIEEYLRAHGPSVRKVSPASEDTAGSRRAEVGTRPILTVDVGRTARGQSHPREATPLLDAILTAESATKGKAVARGMGKPRQTGESLLEYENRMREYRRIKAEQRKAQRARKLDKVYCAASQSKGFAGMDHESAAIHAINTVLPKKHVPSDGSIGSAVKATYRKPHTETGLRAEAFQLLMASFNTPRSGFAPSVRPSGNRKPEKWSGERFLPAIKAEQYREELERTASLARQGKRPVNVCCHVIDARTVQTRGVHNFGSIQFDPGVKYADAAGFMDYPYERVLWSVRESDSQGYRESIRSTTADWNRQQTAKRAYEWEIKPLEPHATFMQRIQHIVHPGTVPEPPKYRPQDSEIIRSKPLQTLPGSEVPYRMARTSDGAVYSVFPRESWPTS
jgi:hypothetical protein